MNDSDKTIAETLNDDQKEDANKESTRDLAMTSMQWPQMNFRAIPRIVASMGGYR